MLPLLLLQDAALAAQVDRIAWAQIIMAVALVLLALMGLGALFAAWKAMRAAQRLMGELQRIADRLSVRAEPMIDAGRRVVDDVSDVSRRLRKQADDFADTLQELNTSLRRGTEEARRRVQEFGAVLDVVSEEAEELLVDTTARARGVRTTADALRGRGGRRRRIPRGPRSDVPAAQPGEEAE